MAFRTLRKTVVDVAVLVDDGAITSLIDCDGAAEQALLAQKRGFGWPSQYLSG